MVLKTDGSGETLASYTLGGTDLISQTRSGVTSYYLQDGQGSTRALTGAAGNVTDTYSYTAFGELFHQTGSTTNSYLYTGQQFDALTELYDLRARYYDPALGRFLSQDTYPVKINNPVELNRYGYAANDPVNRIDPTGYFALENALIRWELPTIEKDTLIGIELIAAAVLIGIVIALVMGNVVNAPPKTNPIEELYNLPTSPSNPSPGYTPGGMIMLEYWQPFLPSMRQHYSPIIQFGN